MVKISIEQTLS